MTNTIILATQRTGSTLLCSEFSGIGGLGRPGEHFLPWLGSAAAGGGARLGRRELEAILSAGRDGSGALGLKLMADYLPQIARGWVAGAGGPDLGLCAGFLRGLMADYGRFAVYRIDRDDRFDQALSRYLAGKTGVYFRTVEGEVQRGGSGETCGEGGEAAMLEGFFPKRVEQILDKIAEETRFLDALCDTLAVPVLRVSYEDLSAHRGPVLSACCAHAGRRVPAAWPKRWMKKVVDRSRRERFFAHACANWAERAEKGAELPESAKVFAGAAAALVPAG